MGTYHGLDAKHLQAYLGEFCYRFNRRFKQAELFSRTLAACLNGPWLTYDEYGIVSSIHSIKAFTQADGDMMYAQHISI